MKLAVTSLGETLDSPVDKRFGRTRYFILYDTATRAWSAHDNKPNLTASQGAGIQAGQKVVNMGTDTLITGHCGPKAFATLTAGNIDVYSGASGSVRESIQAFLEGELNQAGHADVDDHFGGV